ncbi:DUF3097 family protein [Microbacterium sp. AZCO]|uniref:DUF3097 family protein n=1 Tax=Microbacterium sp. AZCO TaxID=3142976 RepID=UPI0031F41D6F
MDDRYGTDVLAAGWKKQFQRELRRVPAERDLVVELAEDGFCGAVTGVRSGTVELEDRLGRRRVFPLGAGFLVDGEDVVLVPPAPRAPGAPARTASGSFAVADARARVARPSRILVEGKHDAELVEKVWGDDLRVEGVVVEFLQGVDLLGAALDEEPPSADRRYGVLVDHLVPGSKESRIAEAIARGRHGAHVRIVGHPYIDVWQCVTPRAVGIAAWPEVPRGIEFKVGVCRALGWPARDQADLARAWQRILASVKTYRDLEPSFLGRVEELIDYVTA